MASQPEEDFEPKKTMKEGEKTVMKDLCDLTLFIIKYISMDLILLTTQCLIFLLALVNIVDAVKKQTRTYTSHKMQHNHPILEYATLYTLYSLL